MFNQLNNGQLLYDINLILLNPANHIIKKLQLTSKKSSRF
jgi:hypothetical protein